MAIQQLIQETDAMLEKLRDLRREIISKEKEQKEALDKEVAAKVSALRAKIEEMKIIDFAPDVSAWEKVVLKPQFEINQDGTGYLLSAHIPGMKKTDVSVTVSDDCTSLIIQGLRLPTPEDLESLAAQVKASLLKEVDENGQSIVQAPDFDLDDLKAESMQFSKRFLNAGAGRFGKFRTVYAIPGDADPDSIGADYSAGLLKILLPKQVYRAPAGFQSLFDPFGGMHRFQPPGVRRSSPSMPGHPAGPRRQTSAIPSFRRSAFADPLLSEEFPFYR